MFSIFLYYTYNCGGFSLPLKIDFEFFLHYFCFKFFAENKPIERQKNYLHWWKWNAIIVCTVEVEPVNRHLLDGTDTFSFSSFFIFAAFPPCSFLLSREDTFPFLIRMRLFLPFIACTARGWTSQPAFAWWKRHLVEKTILPFYIFTYLLFYLFNFLPFYLFTQKTFLTQNIFFLLEKLFWPEKLFWLKKLFLLKKLFWPQKLFWPPILFDPTKLFWPKCYTGQTFSNWAYAACELVF